MIDPRHRRLGGLALVAITVLAATTIAVAVRPVAGTPTAAPVPPAPQVGDCVLTRPTGLGWDDQPGGHPDDPAATAEIGPCDGPRYGEIAHVGAAEASIDAQLGQWPECDQQVIAYLGIPPADGPAGQVWRTSVTALTTGFLWPSRVQAAAGQPWVACVAAISDPFAATIQRPSRVDFTMRGSWSNPMLRDLFGVCRQDPLEYLSCTQPHRTEVLADADLSSPELTQDELDQGCRDLAGAQTGMADSTAAGTLTVEVTIGAYRGQTTDVEPVPDLAAARALDPPADYLSAQCLISTTDPARRLTVSLRSLGTAPVPFDR